MFLVSLELGGRLHMPRQPHCGWKPYFSITVMLALMFVIPHDPSVRVKEVGSSGFKVPNGVHRRAHVRHWLTCCSVARLTSLCRRRI